MSELLILEKAADHTMKLTLDRPDAANALSKQLLYELNEVLWELERNKDIRALIVTGSGEKAFCAGADLKERKGMTEEQVVETVSLIGDTIKRLERMPFPTIAAINGVAFGGGLEMALACDIRVCADTSKMGLTETSLGIIPGAGGTQRLAKLIGIGKAKELIFSARPVASQEALEIGLVEYMYESNVLQEKSLSLAKRIAGNAPIALRQAKKAIHNGFQTDIETGLQIEKLCYQATIPTKDRLEGLQAFKEKRKPIYRGE
ncbi:enoyl-CoA hydratase [Thalassobacillus pellis]|uniref:enoyl-CoA hydratase n=1 Tax=Thalassobacillus pellis TaxID=748008 RepID=UPI001960B205|nr:enoyl-CoA hydratase/carnithine racemase [Thalassobacillus pellis]